MKDEMAEQIIECDVKSCKHLDECKKLCKLKCIKVTSHMLNDSKTYCGSYEK